MNGQKYRLFLFLISLFTQCTVAGEFNDLLKRVADLDKNAIDKIETLSVRGNEKASFLLSQLYYDGILVAKNQERSLSYLSLIKTNKTLLGEKYLLMASWVERKENYKFEDVISNFRKAAQYQNKTAVLSLGLYLAARKGKEDEAHEFSRMAMGYSHYNRSYRELAAISYILTGLHKAAEKTSYKKYAVNTFASEAGFGEAEKILENSSRPSKYLLFHFLGTLKVRSNRNLADVYKLLSKDLSFDDDNDPDLENLTMSAELKSKATAYLADRVVRIENNVPSYFDYCSQFAGSAYNKCLRLIDVITGYCQWPDVLETDSGQFYSSQYFESCRNLYFRKFSKRIMEW